MKIRSLVMSIFLVCHGQTLCADALSRTQNQMIKTGGASSEYFKKITPEILYGYTDFNFNSTSATGNSNGYQGSSNLYSAGADHISWGETVMAGLYYFRIDTSLSAQYLLSPSPLTVSEQTIKNDTIFGHILKIFTPEIYADLAGGYGYNQFTTFMQIDPNSINPTYAQAHNNNDNWFVSLNGIYRKSWQKYLLRANLGVLYSQIDTGAYSFLFPTTQTVLPVDSLTNRATLLLENVELGYFVTPKLLPFVNAGLIQVVQFSNSRPIVSPTSVINGSLPQLNMNKSGFRVGGGVSYTYKNITMRVEEKYYNAGWTFQSYQTLAALEYQFN